MRTYTFLLITHYCKGRKATCIFSIQKKGMTHACVRGAACTQLRVWFSSPPRHRATPTYFYGTVVGK